MSSIHELYKRIKQLPKEQQDALLKEARTRAYYNDGKIRVLAKRVLLVCIALAVATLVIALVISIAAQLTGLPFKEMLTASLWTTVIGAAPYLWQTSELWVLNPSIRIPYDWPVKPQPST